MLLNVLGLCYSKVGHTLIWSSTLCGYPLGMNWIVSSLNSHVEALTRQCDGIWGWDLWEIVTPTRWAYVSLGGQAPGVGDGQGSLVYCSPWGHKESDTTEHLNWTECRWYKIQKIHKRLIAQIFPKKNRMNLPSLFSWDKLIGRVRESTHFKAQVSHRTQNYLCWYLSRSRKSSLSDIKFQLRREKSEFSKETTRTPD